MEAFDWVKTNQLWQFKKTVLLSYLMPVFMVWGAVYLGYKLTRLKFNTKDGIKIVSLFSAIGGVVFTALTIFAFSNSLFSLPYIWLAFFVSLLAHSFIGYIVFNVLSLFGLIH